MNDKAVNVLEQYDMTVNRTFKGRGTIICDTDQGMRVKILRHSLPTKQVCHFDCSET